ncbi:[citrate (pro-3S)-lyase] ligase [uncultured Vagococcus sp.]|uniref:[citrate (pro-3S)-lyase] ligase n=1 Tax=uncultured Vagococcus sp. TaxID=189676 RepID=UPI0028CFE9B3|nr:[citrate (pro-3S)-lyase] ligase [uncultured Vagococcus sp.]
MKRLWLDRDRVAHQSWVSLLEKVGLAHDEEIDYTIGIYQNDQLIATGSLYINILKCLAIDPEFQQENLLTKLVDCLKGKVVEGETHYFVYTKPEMIPQFKGLGFNEIVRTSELVFMEQGGPDFQDYMRELASYKQPTKKNGAIVMNANPFTNGHLYLVTEAAKENETVYVFVVSEDRSLFKTATRMALVKEGVKYLSNVVVLPTRDYSVSSATFPSYFLKNRTPRAIARSQALMDAHLFKERIASFLVIGNRYVGEEPFSPVTAIYNEAMAEVFSTDIQLKILPRQRFGEEIISASLVRRLMKVGDLAYIKQIVPVTTYQEIVKQQKKNEVSYFGN